MANWTRFYAHNFDTPKWAEPDQPTVNLYGKNGIPLFWYSPFAPTDECVRPLPLSDGDPITVPGLMTTSALGLQRTRARREFFVRTLPPDLLTFYDEWLTLLESAAAEYFQLDPSELALVLEPTEVAVWLNEAVRALEGETSMLPSLFDNPGLEFDSSVGRVTRFDPAGVPFILSGASA